jgi:hypothetical protein
LYQNKKWLTDQILSVTDNNYMKAHYYNLLHLICINRFIWKDLPNKIDCDFIERELTCNGELAFIDHPKYGYMITYCMGDFFNLYGRPTRYLCWTVNNEVNDWFEADEVVILRNNKLSQTTHDFIDRYASILAEIQKTKEVNLNALKTPILVQCTEEQRLTLQNFYAQYEGNSPIIYGTKSMDVEGVKVFKTDAPYLIDKLNDDQINEMNSCLTMLGINTAPKKKERLVTDEANANNDMTNICLSIFLNTRKQFIEDVKEKFGVELKLELAEYCKEDLKPLDLLERENGMHDYIHKEESSNE